MSLAESIPFAEIPGQTRLFLDYLRDPKSLTKYYPNAVRHVSELREHSGAVLSSYHTDRGELCDALEALNTSLGAPEATLANIRSLGDPHTVAIVTGQQAGLFTGPLYTIYKALSAIAIAEHLRGIGVSAVPVFWVASEDHDLEEIDHVSLLENGDGLAAVSYRPDGLVEGKSVGEIGLDGRVIEPIDRLFELLPATEFSDEIRALCVSAYQSKENYGSAFTRLLLSLLGRMGLVVIDPLDPEIKRLASPIYAAAIERSDEIAARINERGRELVSDGYHAQVTVEQDYFPLFWHDDSGRRVALKHTGDGMYRVKGEKRQLHRDELLSLAHSEPGRLSPGVMLRAVVQDYLLPTLCYVGGGAEIAYFAQNSETYRALDRPVTPILHRQSFTVVEPREKRNLERFGWKLRDLFAGKEAAAIDAAERTLSPELARLFAGVEERVNTELNRLDQQLAESDPTMAASLARRRQKILHHIATLRDKSLRSEVNKDEIVHRRIDTLFDSLLPNGGLQERELNVLTLLNKYGTGLIGWLYGSIDLSDTGHRVIEF